MKRALIAILSLSLLPLLHAQDSIRRYLDEAEKHQADGEVTLAESEFRQALGMALERLGTTALNQGKYDLALLAYREATEARTNSNDALMGIGVVQLIQRKPEEGIEAVEKILARSPTDSNARLLLAKLYLIAGREKEAAAELEQMFLKNPGDLGASYTLALLYLGQKRLEIAQKTLNRLPEALGDSAELRVLIGNAYKETQFLDPAAEEFKKAIALNPKARRAHFLLAQTYLMDAGRAKMPEAVLLLRDELAIDPGNSGAAFLLGVCYRELRQFELGIQVLEKLVRAVPEAVDAWHFLGACQYGAGHIEAAITSLAKAIQLTTDVGHSDYLVSHTHYVLSQCYQKLGKSAEAEQELRISGEIRDRSLKATTEGLQTYLKSDINDRLSTLSSETNDLRGNSPKMEILLPKGMDPAMAAKAQAELTAVTAGIYSRLGALRGIQNDYPRSADLFQRALAWQPDLKDIRYNLGLTYYHMQAYDRALPLLENELAAKPQNTALQHLVSMCTFYVADFQKAIPMIRNTLRVKPGDPELSSALAIALLRTRQAPEAEKILRGLVAQRPGDTGLHILLGQAFGQQGLYPDAAAEFLEAARLQPKMPEVNYFTGMALLRGSKFEEAEAAFKRELEIRPRDARSHYHLGYLLLMRHQVDEGLAEIQKAVEIEPRYGEAHYQLGKSYMQMGKLDKAKESLEIAVLYEPNKDYIHYQLAQTYQRLGREQDAEREMETYRKLKAQQRDASLAGRGGEPQPVEEKPEK